MGVWYEKNYHRKNFKGWNSEKGKRSQGKGREISCYQWLCKEKSNIIVYTLEYDEFRKHYHIEGENILPTITNIYKGAQWFEEEIQEVMPVKFEGLVFSGRLFLPDEFKEGQGQILIMPLNKLKKLKNNQKEE